jgi:signal transduction histidine kinase
MKAKLSHKIVIAIAIPVLLQVGFFWLLLRSVEQLDQLEKIERETADVLFLRNQMVVAEALVFLYHAIFRVSDKPEYKQKVHQMEQMHLDAFRGINQYWKDDKVKHHILLEQWRYVLLGRIAFKLSMNLPRAIYLRDFFGSQSARGGALMVGYNRGNLGRLFEELERSQTRQLDEVRQKESEIKNEILFALLASLVVSLSVGLLFSRSIVGRLRKVVSNIKAMEQPGATLQAVGGDDEISALNNAVVETNKKIREAEQFQAQTASIVAQELQRPLNEINDLILDIRENGFEHLNENGAERIERSLLEITRLRSLVNDLISLDKISRIGWELEFATVNLAEIGRTAVDTVNDYAKQMGVEIVLRLEDVRVTGDPARLQQIALNLLTNAIKFSKRKSTVEVETQVENLFGKLSVIDHGTGIPEEFQQKIFGHFEQVSRTDATEKGGSGLGLAISKRLVESQQGRMSFKSQLGSGSTFWFSLPLAKSELEKDEFKAERKQMGLQKLTVKSNKILQPEAASALHGDQPSVLPPQREFKSTMWQKSLIIVTIPLAIQFATVGTLWGVIGAVRSNVNEFHRFSQISSCHAAMMDALIKGVISAIVFNVEQDEQFRFYCERERGITRDAIDKLLAASESDSNLAKDAVSLKKMVDEQFALQDEIIRAPRDAKVDQFFGPNSREKTERTLAQVVLPLEKAIQQEKQVVAKNDLAKSQMRQAVANIAIASAISLFLFSVLPGIAMVRGVTARVRKIVDNTRRLAEREPLQAPSGEKDEIGFVEQSFFDAANKLSKLEQYKQELIALTSHEFRTPLTSLLAKADLMEAGVFGPLNQHGHMIVAKIKRNITDLIALLTNLLDVEKIQSGKTLVVKEESSVDDIFGRAVKSLAQSVKSTEVELRVADTNIKVNADSGRLSQGLAAVLADIIQNAPAGSSIALNAAVVNNEARLCIEAPGGEDFKNALNTASARGRLAVDLIRLIAQQHGGRIDINISDKQLLVLVILPVN